MKNLNLFGVFIVSTALLAASSGCHRKPLPDNLQHPQREAEPITKGEPVVPETPVKPTDIGGGLPINYPGGPYAHTLETGTQIREKFQADTVYFDFDKSTVKGSEDSKLQDVANYYKGNTTDALIIEGHCDERGTEKYNLSLGDRRALAIREYLVNLGVDSQRIKTITYGASRPVDPGHNEAAWSKNRRGELILVPPK